MIIGISRYLLHYKKRMQKGDPMKFPQYRPRRLRKDDIFRRMIRETHLRPDDLILPLFVRPGKREKQAISSMPGHSQLSIDLLIKEVQEAKSLGILGVILFGIPEKKDEMGSEAYAEDGIVQRAIRAIKERVEGILVITDVCLCEYTSHGHCGMVRDGKILNDETLDLLAQQALSHATAGADIVAPSDMMDGRVGAIRKMLDENQFEDVPILSYAAKYASSFYGPFRVAAESKPQFGDRKSYQMDPANGDEALREVRLDIEEGADMVMVKPALPYLDIIYRVKQTFNIPVAAYNVSGEFALVKAASQLGWVDGSQVMMESLIAIKRAGADLILTYFAKEAAKKLESRK
jgi:porphobilinogen synthase